jgi:uncharacterized protein (TIGR00369 family)
MKDDIKKLYAEIKALKLPTDIAKKLPPPCFDEMDGKWEQYVHRRILTVSYLAKPHHSNPMGNMQGGYIAAAFDNTFGPLSMVAARAATVTIDLNTQYMRSVKEGQQLIVTAEVVLRGFSTIYLTAQAFNEAAKLIATASTNMHIIRIPSHSPSQ